MTSEDSLKMPLAAQIIEPASAVATLDTLHLKIAIQAAPLRFRPGFAKILEAMDQGQSLQVAVEKIRSTLSSRARPLVDAALRLPEPTKFLLDVTCATESHSRLNWQVRILLIYPLVLIGITAAICAMICRSLNVIVNEGIGEFGLAGYEVVANLVADQLSANIAIFAAVVWCLVIALTIRLCGPSWSFVAVLGGLPIIGKPLRWLSLSELLSCYASALRQIDEPRKATEVTAGSFQNSDLEMVAQLVHQRILGGTSLGTAISQSLLSDSLCTPVLLTLDRTRELSAACQRVSDTIKTMAEARLRLVSGIIPLLVLATIATIVWGTLGGYVSILMLMVRMMTSMIGF